MISMHVPWKHPLILSHPLFEKGSPPPLWEIADKDRSVKCVATVLKNNEWAWAVNQKRFLICRFIKKMSFSLLITRLRMICLYWFVLLIMVSIDIKVLGIKNTGKLKVFLFCFGWIIECYCHYAYWSINSLWRFEHKWQVLRYMCCSKFNRLCSKFSGYNYYN